MKLYTYDRITKEHIREIEARLDPVATEREGKDIFAIPANATEIPPIDARDGFARCFINGAWAQIEDDRGTAYSIDTGSMVEYETLGPLPTSLTKEPKPSDDHIWIDGAWVVDQAKVDARIAMEAFVLTKAQAITKNLPSLSSILTKIDTLDSLAKMREFLKKFVTVVYYDIKNQAD